MFAWRSLDPKSTAVAIEYLIGLLERKSAKKVSGDDGGSNPPKAQTETSPSEEAERV